jgi:hypothetical protein
MAATLAQHRLFCLPPERTQLIQFFIQKLGALARPRVVPQLFQPLFPLAGLVDGSPLRPDSVPPKDRLDPDHRPLGVQRQRFVNTYQFLQYPCALMAVINRTQQPSSQQLRQFPRIGLISFRPLHQ